MPRYLLNEDTPVIVAYGSHRITGYFLSVADTRLEVHEPSQIPHFDYIRYAICTSGTGCYLRAQTGRCGMGTTIERAAMAELWHVYGVHEGDVAKLLAGRVPVGTGAREDRCEEEEEEGRGRG